VTSSQPKLKKQVEKNYNGTARSYSAFPQFLQKLLTIVKLANFAGKKHMCCGIGAGVYPVNPLNAEESSLLSAQRSAADRRILIAYEKLHQSLPRDLDQQNRQATRVMTRIETNFQLHECQDILK